VRNVAAVLGTATTEDHAALIRKSGARRVTLCFDGDAAGGQATHRALAGLLGLEVEIDVVRLDRALGPDRGEIPERIKDPCDLFVRRGAEAFQRILEHAANWFDYLVEGLLALPPSERWAATDRALELIARLRKPVQRDGRLSQLATALGHPVDVVREQFESLPVRLREARRAAEQRSEAPGAGARPASVGAADGKRARAWRDVAGALLREPGLYERARPYVALCEDRALREVLDAQGRLASAGGAADVEAVSTALGPERACDLLYTLLFEAETAENAEILLDGALARIARELQEERVRELRTELLHASEEEQSRILAEIFAIRESHREPSPPGRGTASPAPAVLPAEHATSPGITHV
jgi:DNA primase